jgi:tetratricopeptide (TPR) repeat protein
MYWFMILISMVTIARGDPREELFLQAGHLYTAEKFQEAQDIYQKIEPKNAAVFYNLGNCAYKNKNNAHAYIFWKKASRAASAHLYDAIAHNIAACELPHKEQSYTIVHSTYRIMRNLSLGLLQALFLMMWYSLVLIGSALRRKWPILWGLLIVATITSGVVIMAKYAVDAKSYGLVCKETVAIYAGPNEHFHILGNLDYLAIVSLEQRSNEWYKVAHEGNVGWVCAGAIEEL